MHHEKNTAHAGQSVASSRLAQSLILIGLLALGTPAYAFAQQDAPMMTPDMLPLPKAKEGMVPWRLFLGTREKERKVTFPEGGYAFEASPIFSEELRVFDKKEVKIQGYMFPLEQAGKQTTFLFGPFPPSCPYHYHVPPTLIIEVRAKAPVTYTMDERTLKGTLELVDNDKNGIYYYLKNAEPGKP